MSDIHLEFGDFHTSRDDYDVLVLAGDVGLRLGGLRWAAETAGERPVIYVPGNHEYYGAAMPRLTDELRSKASNSGIFLLERDIVEIDGFRFIGATLWTDFELLGDRATAMAAAQSTVVDYRRVRVSPSFRRLRPNDTASLHVATRRWLDNLAMEGQTQDSIIVTHHAPSIQSVQADLRTDPVSASYASNLDELVKRTGAALWIHGHTHSAVCYELGTTKVLSNPRGYADEPVAGFDPSLVVELSAGRAREA